MATAMEVESSLQAKRFPMSVDETYDKWKTLVPYLYDFFTSHAQAKWPSLSCRWGPVEGGGSSKSAKLHQRLYMSEQTDGESDFNKILVYSAAIVKPRVASAETLSNFDELGISPFFTLKKVINHPGEVNRIRECPLYPQLIGTHTDQADTFIWNTERQGEKCRNNTMPAKGQGSETAKPELILKGHEAKAEYALAFSPKSPKVASGGSDNLVILWSLDDHITTLTQTTVQEEQPKQKTWNSGGPSSMAKPIPTLNPRIKFKGHEATIEEVAFGFDSSDVVVSVGQDKKIMFWDVRDGVKPVAKVDNAHNDDVHCVDWHHCDANLLLTGSADAMVKLWDYRKLGREVAKFSHHTGEIDALQWCPNSKTVFASGSKDSTINVWDISKSGASSSSQAAVDGEPPDELLFQHAGHRGEVVDFQWNPEDPWTMLSVSNDQVLTEDKPPATAQIWRINDLIYKPEKEVLQELNQYKNETLGGKAG